MKTWNPYFSYFHCTPFRPLKTIQIFFVNIFEVFYTACRRNYWTSYSTRSFLDMELRFGGHIQGKLQMFLYLSHLSPKMTPNMKLYMQHRVYLHFFGFLHRSIPTLDRANSLCYRTVNKKKIGQSPPPPCRSVGIDVLYSLSLRIYKLLESGLKTKPLYRLSAVNVGHETIQTKVKAYNDIL